MDSSRDRLTPLQRDLLVALFTRSPSFFLSGGAALAGFHLRGRQSMALDLFAQSADDASPSGSPRPEVNTPALARVR